VDLENKTNKIFVLKYNLERRKIIIYTYRIERETTTELRTKGREFINTYHSYIKWSDRPSRKIYWNLYENETMVGVFALSSVFDKPKSVKEYMIKYNLKSNEIGNNIVFCLANQKNKNAGTILLSMVRKDAISWWYERYGDLLKAFQTFILPPRTGAVYKADNWQQIGITSGSNVQVRTIRECDLEKYKDKDIRKSVYKSGEIRYIYHEFVITNKKLIFMKLNKEKEINKLIHKN
jgi:hypothetical protein